MTAPTPAAAVRVLMEKMSAAWIAQALAVAAALGIADHLSEGPLDASDLAARCGADGGALYRILRALASQGIFTENAAGRFVLTPLAEPLRDDANNSVRAYVAMAGSQWQWRAWGEMLYSARTGKPAFDRVFGEPVFDYYSSHPDAQRLAAAALTSRSRTENAAIVSAYDFADADVFDIGGGEGSLLAEILRVNPDTRGTLFEREPVLASARCLFESADFAARCRLMAGDFFGSVPAGGDIYVLKKVIHDWEDARATAILRNCRRAMEKTARLLLIESIVPPGNEPAYAKLLDLLMLVYAGGRERTAAEYKSLLGEAALTLSRIIPTASGVSILEARPTG